MNDIRHSVPVQRKPFIITQLFPSLVSLVKLFHFFRILLNENFSLYHIPTPIDFTREIFLAFLQKNDTGAFTPVSLFSPTGNQFSGSIPDDFRSISGSFPPLFPPNLPVLNGTVFSKSLYFQWFQRFLRLPSYRSLTTVLPQSYRSLTGKIVVIL